MAVGAHIAVHIEIIEQHELARDLVFVGRDLFPEQHEGGIAVAFLHIPEHLVVGAVFLNDVDDVLDGRERIGGVQFLVAVGGVGHGDLGVRLELLAGEGFDERGRAGLNAGHVFDDAGVALVAGLRTAGGIRPVRIRMRTAPAAIQHHQRAVRQHARRGGIPAGGDEPFDMAAFLGDIHHGHHVGVGADHVESLAFLAGGQRAGSHAGGLARRHGGIDGLDQGQFFALGDAQRVNAVGIGGGDKQARDPWRFPFGRLALAGEPEHVGGMRAEPHGGELVAGGGVIVAYGAIRPACDEEGLAIRMEEDAVGAAAGFDAIDDHAGLRIDHHHRVVIQFRGVDQAAVGGKRDVADEVGMRALVGRNNREGAGSFQRAIGEGELVDRRARSAAHVDAVALRRKGQAQPAVGHGHTMEFASGSSVQHADGGRLVSAVQHQEVSAIGRERCRHGESVQRDLFAGWFQAPAAVEQESASGKRADLLARGRLGTQESGSQKEGNDEK